MSRVIKSPGAFVRADVIGSAVIGLVALAARLIYLAQARSHPLADKVIMDARSYWEWSDRLAKGDWLGDQVFYQAPLYPYFLGVLKSLFGADLGDVKLVQAVLGAGACVMMFLAARLWMSAAGLDAVRARRVGLRAGLVLALYPPAIFLDSLIQKANLGVVWMTLLLWLLARVWVRPSAWRALGLGMVMGLLMLTREETLLLAPVVGLVTAAAGWRWCRAAAKGDAAPRQPWRLVGMSLVMLVVGMAGVLGPVAWRNHRVGGEWVLTTSQAGPNFYIGNNPAATGIYAPLRPGRSNTPFERRDAFELATEAMGRPLTPTEVSRYWMGQATDFIFNQPVKWLKLMGRKCVLLINRYETPDSEDQYSFEEHSWLLRGLGVIGHLGVLAPFAAAGFVLSLRYWRGLWPVYAVLATVSGAVVLFYVFARYRFPIVPTMLPLVGLAMVEVVERVRRREWRSLGMPAAAAVALAIPANWTLFDKQAKLSGTISNAGAAVAQAGDDAGAIKLYERALALRPESPDTLTNLALSQARLGRLAEAEQTMRRAMAMRPDDPRINFRLGTLLVELNRAPESLPFLKKAVELAPQDVDARVNYTTVLSMLRRHADLVVLLRESIKRDPGNLSHAANLAWTLATSTDDAVRNGREAVGVIREAIARAPSPSADLTDILAAALAETGDFAGAAAASQQAINLANKPGSGIGAEMVAGFRARQDLYRAGKPARE